LARYGGEEFVCLLPQTSRQTANQIGEKICALVLALAISHTASPTAETLSISVGGACQHQFVSHTPAELLKQADDCLYQAKEQGRNRIISLGF